MEKLPSGWTKETVCWENNGSIFYIGESDGIRTIITDKDGKEISSTFKPHSGTEQA